MGHARVSDVEILIPWRTDGDQWRAAALDWCVARWRTLFPSWDVVFADDGQESGWFHIARALNRCVDASSARVCVVVGADTVLRSEKVLEAVTYADAKPCWVMAADTMHRLDRPQTELVLGLEPDGEIPRGLGRRRVCQLGWGPIVAQRHLLLERLWNEEMVAGGEDDTFGLAAETLWGPPERVTSSPVHLLFHEREWRHQHPLRGEAVALKQRYVAARWQPEKMWKLAQEWQLR